MKTFHLPFWLRLFCPILFFVGSIDVSLAQLVRVRVMREGETQFPLRNVRVYYAYDNQGWAGNYLTTNLQGEAVFTFNPPAPSSLAIYIGSFASYAYADTIQIDPALPETERTILIGDTITCRNDFAVQYLGGSGSSHDFRLMADTTMRHLLCFYNWLPDHGEGRVLYEWFVDGTLHDSATISQLTLPWGSTIYKTNVSVSNNNPHNVCLRITDVTTGFQAKSCKTIQAPPPPGDGRILVVVKANGEVVSDSVELTLLGLPDVVHGLSDTVVKTGIRHIPAGPDDSLYYYFDQVPFGRYLLHGNPYGAVLSQGFEPTYYQSSLFWETADSIRFPNSGSQFTLNLIPRFNPAGLLRPGVVSGFVSGLNVICSTSLPGVPTVLSVPFQYQRVRVFIVDAQGRPVASTDLSSDGTFFLDNLPIGSYTLRFDHPLINSTLVPVEFTTASPTMVVQSDVTEFGIGFITQTRKPQSEAHIQVFPNPTRDHLFVSGFEDVATLKISNQLGKDMALEPGERIPVESLPPGVYFLHGTTKIGQPFVRRFVRN